MAKVLTDAAVRKFKPGSERRRIRDGGARSLFLIIEPSGHRSWQMRFRRPDGRPAKITLGPLDISGKELKGEPEIGQPLSVAAARALAAAVHRRRALGDDPIADHKARKHRQRAEAGERQAGSFGTCIRDYVAEYARPETRNWQETARLLGLRYPEDGSEPEEISRGLASRWADKPVRNIDGHDIWSVIDEARRVGVPGLGVRNHGLSEARARALFVALSSLFSWVLRQRRVDNMAPCLGRRERRCVTAC